MLTAQELFIPGQTDPLILLQNLIDSQLFSDYMMYQQEREVRIAANPLATVSVSAETLDVNCLGQTWSEPIHDPLKQVESALASLPLENWTAYGYISFDLARFYYPYTKQVKQPLLYFFVPETELKITPDGVQAKSLSLATQISEICSSSSSFKPYRATTLTEIDWTKKERYTTQVEQLIQAIQSKKLHKAIISHALKLKGELDLIGTYALGTQDNNFARSYCLKIGDVCGVGFSPEILMEIRADNLVVTNPLAGTRARGENLEEDIRLQRELFSEAKEVKEHALSIWLVQQEMESFCIPKTIQIRDFMQVKKYRYVQHISSQVLGEIRPDKTLWDALKALFPAVTVSGIEKHQAIEWIDRLEDEPRGIYAGAIGWINSKNQVDLAIPIRSAYQYKDWIHLNAGAGIMAESIPQREYIECRNKMNTILTNLVLKN